jgi:hypothetical protein
VRSSSNGKTHDVNGQNHIFYVKNGIVLIPRCISLESAEIKCEKPNVRFHNDSYGFLNNELIISSQRPTDCGYNDILLPASQTLLTNDRDKLVQIKVKTEQFNAQQSYALGQRAGFPHERQLFSAFDTIRNINYNDKISACSGASQDSSATSDLASTWNSITAEDNGAFGSMKTLGFALVACLIAVLAVVAACIIYIVLSKCKRVQSRQRLDALKQPPVQQV